MQPIICKDTKKILLQRFIIKKLCSGQTFSAKSPLRQEIQYKQMLANEASS